MQKPELLAYQKQINKVRSFLTECVEIEKHLLEESLGIDNRFPLEKEEGKSFPLQNENWKAQWEIAIKNAFDEIKKLNTSTTDVVAELKIVSFTEGKEATVGYVRFITEIIQQEINKNSPALHLSERFFKLASKPHSNFTAFRNLANKKNPIMLEECFAYYQVTLCESISVIESIIVNLKKVHAKKPTKSLTKKPTKKEVIEKALTANRGYLSSDQRKRLATKYNFSLDSFNNAFYAYFNKRKNK